MKYKQHLEHYLSNPGRFSILILGERGTGKTKLVKEISEEKEKVIVANCASFSDDTMAESELFGHKKGAFTGASESKKGLFEEADRGILFLDEVHNLSLRVQEKLMTALQTESSGRNKGKFSIRRLGETESHYVSVRPVFASNLTIQELKKKLLPDLYDRISQLVIEIPSIQESKVDLKEEFKKVWEGMQFQKNNSILDVEKLPELPNLYKWLKRIKLDGNYRTLQNIAINWHQGRIMKFENEEAIFEYVKNQIEKFHSSNTSLKENIKYNFRKGVTKKEMEQEYRKALYEWALKTYGTAEEAQEALDFSRLKTLN